MQGAVLRRLFHDESESVEVGRFTLLEKVGEGAMGVVYRALDRRLNRTVAVKMIRPNLLREERARMRALREARALASLSHPSIVHVYEVDTLGEQLFIAMEYVPGPTLRNWLLAEPRTWRQILEIFVSAGQGLAAAHGKGLVHLDFKPDNVLVAEDGSVRVVDFGLARLRKDLPAAPGLRDATHDAPFAVVTRAFGTPAYMAPEQRTGHTPNAQSDQYAFCVALYEALVGERPTRSSRPRRRKPGAAPSWLLRILARGLAPDPANRWPNMDALLAQLESGRRRRTRRIALGAAVLGLGGAAGLATVTARPHPLQLRCEGAAQRLESVAGVGRRADMGERFRATGLAFATDTWLRLDQHMQSYAEAWHHAHAQICGGDFEAEDRPRQVTCLERATDPLAVLMERLDHPERSEVETVSAAELLDPKTPESCVRGADVGHDLLAGALDDGAWQELVAVRVEARLGDYASASTRAVAILEGAAAQASPALAAEALYWQGYCADRLGNYADAERLLQDAYQRAQAAHLDAVAVDSGVELVSVVGTGRGRYDEAMVRAQYARGLLARTGGRPDARAALDTKICRLLTDQGRYEESIPACARAIEIHESELGGQGATYAEALFNSGLSFFHQHDYQPAREQLDRALERTAAERGPKHPHNVRILSLRGYVLRVEGRDEASRDALERALALGREVLGSDHPDLAAPHLDLGWLEYRRHNLDRAEQHFETALTIRRAALGDTHPTMGTVYGRLGIIARARGELDRAEVLQRRAFEIELAASGPDNSQLCITLINLSSVLREKGDWTGAERALLRAVELLEEAYGRDHATVSPVLSHLQEVYADSGQPEKAAALRKRQVRLWTARIEFLTRKHGPNSDTLQKPWFALANARLQDHQYDGAAQAIRRHLELLRASPKVDRVRQLAALGVLRDALDRGGRAEQTIGLVEQARSLANAPGPATELRRGMANMLYAGVAWSMGRAQEAHACARQALEALERGQHTGRLEQARKWIAEHPLDAGD